MLISEIFYSLQGEGENIGIPSVFLRLNGCNLRCSWCDTKYSWNNLSGEKMSITQILKEIKKFPSKHLVITGGEPLLQQEELEKLLEKLPDYFIEIETNGSIKPKLKNLIDKYNCSPKIAYFKRKNINLKLFPVKKTTYKFVVNKKSDIKDILTFIKKHKIKKENVFLMPQGNNKKTLEKKSLWLAEVCIKENLRFTPRLHIYIWDNQRKR